MRKHCTAVGCVCRQHRRSWQLTCRMPVVAFLLGCCCSLCMDSAFQALVAPAMHAAGATTQSAPGSLVMHLNTQSLNFVLQITVAV
jgi:hypothetical protein